MPEDPLARAKRLLGDTAGPGDAPLPPVPRPQASESVQDRARRLLDEADRRAASPAPTGPGPHAARRGSQWGQLAWYWAARCYRRVEPGLTFLWNTCAYPLSHWVWPALQWGVRSYIAFFLWASWRPDPKTGEYRFSKASGSAAAVATILAAGLLWFGLGPFVKLGTSTGYEAAMSLTERQESLYVLGAATIEEGKQYAVQACKSLPCTGENTIHLHIEQDLYYGRGGHHSLSTGNAGPICR